MREGSGEDYWRKREREDYKGSLNREKCTVLTSSVIKSVYLICACV